MQALFSHIDAHADDFVDRVMDYVKHPSISAHDIGNREVAGMLVAHLDRLGFDAGLIETQGHPFVLGHFAAPLRRAIVAARGVEPLIYPAIGGSLPDYVFTKILGKDAFVIPYANADEANHAPNENLEVVRFIDGIKTGAAVLAELGRMEKPGR